MVYKIPPDRFYRLHHIRPRFKNDVENVLLYIANQIVSIPKQAKKVFADNLNKSIQLFPNNASKDLKTINNWRTEISSLFGLICYDEETAYPSPLAVLLSENQDLIEFFRYFLFRFQYPGGHLKSQENLKLIQCKIQFHPTSYLIKTLLAGNTQMASGKFGISKAEATHCIFNDLAVTRDQRDENQTIELILYNRKQCVQYDCAGDVVRYAGDILDYMKLADLVRLKPDGFYYLNTQYTEIIKTFTNPITFFQGYSKLYNIDDLDCPQISELEHDWFLFVNDHLNHNLFRTDIETLLTSNENEENHQGNTLVIEFLNKLKKDQETPNKLKTKEIGDIGEALVLQHEKQRMLKCDREDLVHLIQRIPTHLAAGYDIKSFEGTDENFRHIEVKTTISHSRLSRQNFHLTPNEWRSATSYLERYFIYRLMISTDEISLFIIQNPVGLYKANKLEMTPLQGVDVRYREASGYTEELLA